MYSSMYLHMFCCTTCFVQWVEGYLVACMSHYIVDPTRSCDPCTVSTLSVDTGYVRSKALRPSFVCQGVKII